MKAPERALSRAAVSAIMLTIIAVVGPSMDISIDLSAIPHALGYPEAKLVFAATSAKLDYPALSAITILDLALLSAAIYRSR